MAGRTIKKNGNAVMIMLLNSQYIAKPGRFWNCGDNNIIVAYRRGECSWNIIYGISRIDAERALGVIYRIQRYHRLRMNSGIAQHFFQCSRQTADHVIAVMQLLFGSCRLTVNSKDGGNLQQLFIQQYGYRCWD